jgi:Leucine-rich repeat (LRR) protein
MEKLSLNSNRLKSIDDGFTSEMKLVELNIESNQISVLPLSLFKVTSIKNLIIVNNLLT